MLHIDADDVPDYLEKWPPTESEDKDGTTRYSMHPVTQVIGISAMQTQLPKVTAENIDEWLYRLGCIAKLHKHEQDITREHLVGHIGLRINVGLPSTRAQFDDWLDMRTIEEAGGFPGVWYHIRQLTLDPAKPCDIYIEMDRRRDLSEHRRVEVYPGGHTMAYDDGYDHLKEDGFEDGLTDPISLINQRRRDVRAQLTDEATFKALYDKAHNPLCGWVEDDAPCTTGKEKETDAWCPTHQQAIATNLPRIIA